MSIEAMSIALNHSKARGTTKLVLVGIASHDGDAGSFPKVATLAKYANVHPRRVQAAIAALVKLGEISVDTKEGGMRNIPDHLRPNLYHFLLSCPPECDGTTQHRIQDQKIARSRKGTGGYVDNRPRTGDENSTGDENVTSTGDENVSRKNHPLEPPFESPGLPESGTSPADATICWACGQPRASKHRTYCSQCESEGKNNPMVSCVHDGCDSGVRRRTHPGQQYFRCAEHRDEKQPLTGAGAA